MAEADQEQTAHQQQDTRPIIVSVPSGRVWGRTGGNGVDESRHGWTSHRESGIRISSPIAQFFLERKAKGELQDVRLETP